MDDVDTEYNVAPSLALTEGDQTDSDGDGILDTDDNCPSVPNQDQQDSNDNNVGDVCDENVVLPEGNLAVDEGVAEAQDQDQQDDAEANGETDGDEDTTNPEEPEQELEGGDGEDSGEEGDA